jgi:hypothetical protein
MQTVKEVIKKYAIWSEDLQEEVIPVSKLDKAIAEFEGKPFEQQLTELQQAMEKLGDMFNEVGKKVDD